MDPHFDMTPTYLMRYVDGRHFVAPLGINQYSPTSGPAWSEYTLHPHSPASELVNERNELARCNKTQGETIDRLQKTVEDQKRVILLLTRQNEELIKSVEGHKQVRHDKDHRITQLLIETGAVGGRSVLEQQNDDLSAKNANQIEIIRSLGEGIAERDARIAKLREKAKRRSVYVNGLRDQIQESEQMENARVREVEALSREVATLRGHLRAQANPIDPFAESTRSQLIADVINRVRRVLKEDTPDLNPPGFIVAGTQMNPIPYVDALIAKYEHRAVQINMVGQELLRLRNTLDAIRSVLK